MMWTRLLPVLVTAIVCASAGGLVWAAAPDNLDQVRAVRNLERRSRMALEYAHAALDRAMKTYLGGDLQAGLLQLVEIQEAVELSQESLKGTGKTPSRSPKHFKRAEIETRNLLRELESAESQVNFDDRGHVRAVFGRVEEINKELLLGIMTKPKK
jgi:hypothetical protein